MIQQVTASRQTEQGERAYRYKAALRANTCRDGPVNNLTSQADCGSFFLTLQRRWEPACELALSAQMGDDALLYVLLSPGHNTKC